jgi:hypothetical protein
VIYFKTVWFYQASLVIHRWKRVAARYVVSTRGSYRGRERLIKWSALAFPLHRTKRRTMRFPRNLIHLEVTSRLVVSLELQIDRYEDDFPTPMC